jgi:hypothetical protein
MISKKQFIVFNELWYVDPLLGNDREISNYKIGVAK